MNFENKNISNINNHHIPRDISHREVLLITMGKLQKKCEMHATYILRYNLITSEN